MKHIRSLSFAVITLLSIAGIATTIAQAQQAVRYKCNRCGLMQVYAYPGIYKCPNDGSTMIRMY